MKKLKNTNGITLVTLVITIIVLLILSGITISKLLESQLIKKAEFAKDKYQSSQENENTILKEYEEQIIGTNRENTINDLEIVTTEILKTNIIEKIEVKNKYKNAVYVYLLNDRIIAHIEQNSIEIGNIMENETINIEENIEEDKPYIVNEELKPDTTYKITIVVVENNGKIHKGMKEFKTRKENFDVYGKIQNDEKTVNDLEEYGITYSIKGKNEYNHNELYDLGMGSYSGINSNVFTLNIDYKRLISKIGNIDFKGICGQFYQYTWNNNTSYMSWIYSKIIVIYEDDTTSEISTKRTEGRGGGREENVNATIIFDKEKKIKNIQMIIYEYDSDYGGADASIRNIELIQ